MSDTIQSPPPEDIDGRSATDSPPTAAALAAWSIDFETKFFAQQASNHGEQLAEIRAGQTAMLASFQETVSNSISRLEVEFGKALKELREKRHDTANALNKLKLELQERHYAEDKRAELINDRIEEIERWKLEQIKKTHPEPPIEPSPRSGS